MVRSTPLLRDEAALSTFPQRLAESDMFHAGMGKVQRTLESMARRLEDAGIAYAIVGGMALNAHGYPRETVDVDVLVTPEGLESFKTQFVGRGYRPAFPQARKSFLDAETGVRVEFLTTGDYPGDGKPKPVAFPDPAQVAVLVGTAKVIRLPELINLKLASGMTNPGRLRDLADVQELIRTLQLDAHFADTLHPYVRDRYLELLRGTQSDAAPAE